MNDILRFMEPITEENIGELKPGDWIWDNRIIIRKEHKRSMGNYETIIEPVGFRQIDILDTDGLGRWTWMPFMLSTIDYDTTRREWVYFSEGRFFRFRREKEDE